MKNFKKIIIILVLSTVVMSLNSCSVLLSTAYAVSGIENMDNYGPTPIPVGENMYITPGVSEKVEYGISLAAAQKKLPSYVKIVRTKRLYRDFRGCIGWVLECYDAKNLETCEYTVTKHGSVRR